jgi:hypothetical protein
MSWITLRYRVVAAANAWESGPPTDWYSPFWVDLAVPGVVPVSVEAPLEKYVHYLGPGDGDETWWATEWRSWNLPVPVNPTPPEGLGFAIHTGSLTDACFGEMLPPGKRAIVIEEISPIGVK